MHSECPRVGQSSKAPPPSLGGSGNPVSPPGGGGSGNPVSPPGGSKGPPAGSVSLNIALSKHSPY